MTQDKQWLTEFPKQDDVLPLNALYRAVTQLRNKNARVYEQYIKGRRVTVKGRLLYVTENGNIGLVNGSLWRRMLAVNTGPQVQVQLTNPNAIMAHKTQDTLVISGRVANVSPRYQILSLEDAKIVNSASG